MKAMFRILQPTDFTPEIIQQVIDLGMRSGTWQESDKEYYEEQLLNPENINIVYQDENCSIVGHIVAKPHNDAVQDYLVEDPAMKNSEVAMYYVDDINVDKVASGRSFGMRLISEIIKEANRRGVSRFSMHCRVINGLNKIIQHKFKDGVRVVRRINSYMDCNDEPFDYMEIVVAL